MTHALETLSLLMLFTGDPRFADAYQKLQQGEEINMFTMYDAYEQKGEEKGKKKLADIFSWLFKTGRITDVEKAANDEGFRLQIEHEYDEANIEKTTDA